MSTPPPAKTLRIKQIIEHLYKENKKIVKYTCRNVFQIFTLPRVCECANYHSRCVKNVLSGKSSSLTFFLVELTSLNVQMFDLMILVFNVPFNVISGFLKSGHSFNLLTIINKTNHKITTFLPDHFCFLLLWKLNNDPSLNKNELGE